MKLTKKLEAEILKTYNDVWDAYLRGDMRTFASILDENCYIIGSAAGEIFNNKKAAVKYYKSTAEQITGKAEFRNRKINVMPADKGFMVNEVSDFYLLIDDQWTFYGPGRISSLFHKKNNKWKVIHQHGSFPDSKTEGGEQVNTEKIKAENIQLRDAVKRRTVELENKNRELEIETALERVRAVAMGMGKPEDLSAVGEIVFKELKGLGFADLRNTEIIIINDIKETLTSHYYSDYGVTGVVEVLYKTNPKVKKWVKDLKKANNAFAEVVIHKKEIAAWRKYREEVGHKPDPKLNKAKEVYYYSYSIGSGGLSISTFKPATAEQIKILERFRNVFNLSYQRYIDIAQAETQSREAQIELGLERVRARTMAMQKSDELREAVLVIYEQLKLLNFESNACNIIIIDKESGSAQYWVSGFSQEIFPVSYAVPYLNHPYQDALLEPWKQGDKYVVYEYAGKMKQNFDEIFFTQTDFRNVPDEAKNVMIGLKSVTLSTAFITYGALQSLGAEPLSDENANILQRFAKVFEQTYTRFLDLQKAEAQAKEAQIEASLERVRSRAMAMQSSDELKELIGTVFTELTKLDLVLTRCVILIYEGNEKGVRWWMANSEAPSTPMSFFVKYADLPFFNYYLKGWNERSLKWQYILEGEDKIRTDNVLFNETELSQLPDFVIAGMKANDRVYLSASFNNYGCLNLASLEPLSDEHFDILLRFAKVFDLTYTRFNDLKQAEAQAKESRIQLALERVRARTMAMQKSDELAEAAQLLYEEFRSLNINTFLCGYCFYKEEQNIQTVWVTTPDGTLIPDFTDFPLGGDHVLNKRYEDWKQKKPLHVLEIKGEVNIEHHRFLASVVPKQITQEIFSQIPERIIFYCANFSAGYLFIIATEFLSNQEEEVITRFAKVFELSYTRFNDLKQAEAQAREAEIELALERVRAKSMSMRHSDELADLVKILFKELTSIGFSVNGCIIMTYDERTNDSTWWIANFDGVSNPVGLLVLNHSHEPYLAYLKEWKKQTPKWSYKLGGAEKKKWDQYIFKHSGLAALPDEVKTGMQSVKDVHLSVCFNKYASITFGSLEPMGDKDFDTLHRFAKVFEQSYTRFLDLQNAEAQTREAKIETALEKVRSRSLAMHKSDELQEVVNTVFERLEDLNIEMDSANIAIFKEGSRDYDYWIASHFQKRAASFHMPYLDLSLTRDITAARESGTDFSATAYSFEEKNEWFDYAFKNTDFKFLSEERKQFILNAPGIMVAIAFSKHTGVQVNRYSGKLLTEGEAEILKRFSKVFEQAYIRFLDLEKAEAQAKEARIEIALERIRARALAMHKSDELMEVAKVMREQMAFIGPA